MIRTADLFSIASSGLNASNQLLNTTGHNIANVNTEGYVRERTSFATQLSGGVGPAMTERIINTFAQNQLRRDETAYSELEVYHDKTAALDNLFAGEANSLARNMSRLFESIQTAADDPTNMASRELALGQANGLVGQIGVLSNFLAAKEKELNQEMQSHINRANSLIENISELNAAIRTTAFNNQTDVPGALMNERDQAILELSKLMAIETRDNGTGDGSVMVNLKSGESLVLDDGTFNVFQLGSDPDLTFKKLQLSTNFEPPKGNTVLGLSETEVGGKIGGLFRYRDEVLANNQREIGQIAMALAESMNQQNRLGMDFDQQLGSNIFSLPSFSGLNYTNNAASSQGMIGRFTPGQASNITSADYQITVNNVTAGVPPTLDITVAVLQPNGEPVTDINGTPITQTYTGLDAAAGSFNQIIGGIEVEFAGGANYAAGDQFLLQPTKNTATQLELLISRPEDLAFASPFRVDADSGNLGDAKVVSSQVTNTTVAGAGDPQRSVFDGAGGFIAGAPVQVVFNSATEYELRDSTGTVLTTVSGVTDLNNLIEQAKNSGVPAWPGAGLNDFPGYDFSMQGIPKAGDSFDLSYNTGGLDDNRNAIALAELQNKNTMQLNNSGTGTLVSFHESYSSLVGSIGEKASSADISLKAADAMRTQSRAWFDSVSGVNLDEEAANLIRFQQSYSAAARLLGTAQTLFDTILSSVR